MNAEQVRQIVREELSIQQKINKAGEPWSPLEDKTLANEVRVALTNISKAHGRSFGAIASRIRRNDLMFISENE
jgi:hypothetical protein